MGAYDSGSLSMAMDGKYVDALPFVWTMPDVPEWRHSISIVTVNGIVLPQSQYSFVDGQLSFVDDINLVIGDYISVVYSR